MQVQTCVFLGHNAARHPFHLNLTSVICNSQTLAELCNFTQPFVASDTYHFNVNAVVIVTWETRLDAFYLFVPRNRIILS